MWKLLLIFSSMSHKSKPGITELESDLKYSYELTILKISQEVHKIMSAVCAIILYTVDELNIELFVWNVPPLHITFSLILLTVFRSNIEIYLYESVCICVCRKLYPCIYYRNERKTLCVFLLLFITYYLLSYDWSLTKPCCFS